MEAGVLEMSNPDSGLMQGTDPAAFQRFCHRIDSRRFEFINAAYQPQKISGLLPLVPSQPVTPQQVEKAINTVTIWFRQLTRNGRGNPALNANQNGLQGMPPPLLSVPF